MLASMTKRTKTILPGPPLDGHMSSRWHPETFWCSLKGHVVPAARVRTVSERDALVALPIGPGMHIGRCLRCDAWVIANPVLADADTLASLDQLGVPQRGKDLRDAIILKLIAIDRGIHAIVFALVFIGLLLVELHLRGLQDTARHLVSNAQNTLDSTGQESGRGFAVRQLDHFISLNKGGVVILMGTAGVYAVIEGIEAVGLWMQKRWAEYLTALATVGFLPLEIHELMKRVTVVRVGALVINIAVLVYLVYAKRLFGVRGGGKRDEELLRTAEKIALLPGQPEPS